MRYISEEGNEIMFKSLETLYTRRALESNNRKYNEKERRIERKTEIRGEKGKIVIRKAKKETEVIWNQKKKKRMKANVKEKE